MSTNLKISLSILFVAIVAFAGIYAKFNVFDDGNKEKIVMDEIVTNMNNESDLDLFNSNKLDLLIERSKNQLERKSADLEILTKLAGAYLQKGSLEFKEKEYGEKGLEIAEKILAINPNSVIGFNLKGYAYEIMEKYPESLKAYKKSLEIEKTVDILNQIGHVYDLMGNDKKSREYYALAAKISPNNVNVKMNLARVDYDDKKYSEALEGFKYVFENDTNARRKAEAAYMVSQVYLTDKLYNEKLAKEYVVYSNNSDKNFPMAWVGLGQMAVVNAIYNEKSDFDKEIANAIKYYNKAIKLYPNQTEAHLQKAKLMFILKDDDEASKSYNNALKSVTKDITLMNNDKIEFKKFIEDEINLRKIKISKIDGEYIFGKALVALTFPGNASAYCTGHYGTNRKCTTRKEALELIKQANNNIGNDKSSPHYFTFRNGGTYAACGNGAKIE